MKVSLSNALLYLTIFCLPLQVYYILLPGDIHLSLTFSLVIILSFALLFRWKISAHPVVYFMAFYLLWSFIGIAASGFHWESLRGLGVSLLYVTGFLFTYNSLNSRRSVENAVTAFIVCGIVSAIMGLTEFISFTIFDKVVLPPFTNLTTNLEGGSLGGYGYMGGLMRMHGFFLSANRLGAFLLVPFSFSIYRAIYSEKVSQRRKNGIACLIIGAAILFCLARNAYLGLLLMILIVSVSWKRAGLKRYFALSFFVLFFVFLALNPETGFTPLDHANPFGYTTEDEYDFSKVSSVTVFSEHAVAAVIANYETMFLGKGVQLFDDWAFDQGYASSWGSHSNFLIFLGESGLPGLLAHLIVVYIVLRSCWRRYKVDLKAGRPPKYLYIFAMLCALISTGVTRTFYYTETSYILYGIVLRMLCFDQPAKEDGKVPTGVLTYV